MGAVRQPTCQTRDSRIRGDTGFGTRGAGLVVVERWCRNGSAEAPVGRPHGTSARGNEGQTGNGKHVQYNAKAPRSLIDRRQREPDGRRPGNGPEESPGTVGQGAG